MRELSISFPLLGGGEINPPRFFNLFGLRIYFYGIIIAVGFILAALYVLKRREDFGLTQDNVLDIFLCAVAGGIGGARLFYVIFNPSDYFGAGKWVNIIRFRDGGLAIYGGIILGAVVTVIYCRIKKINVPTVLDAGGIAIPIGQAIGRWGNFVNREAFGYETAVPWRMGLTDSLTQQTIYVHPTFLYESLWNAVGFLLLHFYSRHKKYDGQMFLLFVFWYGLGRVWIEGLRTDSLYVPGTEFRISQVIAAACVIISALIMGVVAAKMKRAAKAKD